MRVLMRIAGYALRDVGRNPWLLAYALLLFAGVEGLLRLSAGPAGALAGVTSLMLLVTPLVSLVFGVMYLQASRDFLGLLLPQPIGRFVLFGGLYAGIGVALAGAFALGCGLPLLLEPSLDASALQAAALLLVAGVLLTFCFLSLAFLSASLVSDRARALGTALVVWLFYAVVFDGLLLAAVAQLQDYPLERPLVGALLLNPIDLARVLVVLRLDAAALLGYTGAVLQELLGRPAGIALALAALLVWAAGPLAWALRRFGRADF